MIVTMEIPTIDQIHMAVVVVGVIITMVRVVTIIQETIIIVVREVDGRIIFGAKINNNNNNTTLISSKIAIVKEICHDHDRRLMINDVVIDR